MVVNSMVQSDLTDKKWKYNDDSMKTDWSMTLPWTFNGKKPVIFSKGKIVITNDNHSFSMHHTYLDIPLICNIFCVLFSWISEMSMNRSLLSVTEGCLRHHVVKWGGHWLDHRCKLKFYFWIFSLHQYLQRYKAHTN